MTRVDVRAIDQFIPSRSADHLSRFTSFLENSIKIFNFSDAHSTHSLMSLTASANGFSQQYIFITFIAVMISVIILTRVSVRSVVFLLKNLYR